MKKIALILVGLLLGLSGSAYALSSTVQFDPTGNGAYSIKGIFEFDWQSSGNLAIEQSLVSSSNGATSLAGFFATAVDGDTLSMNIHAQARLNDFLDIGGNGLAAPGLSTSGSGGGSYEVTATLDAVESATYQLIAGQQYLFFGGITGTFNYYLDTTPDSVVATGAGFNDGSLPGLSTLNPFLTGTLGGNAGNFNGTLGTGSSFLTNTITSYDKMIIDVDPNADPSIILIGTSFDSTIKFLGNQTGVGVGGSIGDAPYTVLLGDLVLNADANSEWSSIPEPATMLLFGIGLLGLSGVARRKK